MLLRGYGETSTSIHREIAVLKTKAWRSSILRYSLSLAVYNLEGSVKLFSDTFANSKRR
jgi:hypothetical protein